MKLIDRYLLRTFAVPFAYCLCAFVLLYIVYDLFDHLPDFIKAGTSLAAVLRFYAFLLPSVVVLIVPMCLLLAVLYCLSTLTKNNELTAIRSCGVSTARLLVPFLAAALAASAAVAVVNEKLGPDSAYWCAQFLRAEKYQDDVDLDVVTNHPVKNEIEHRLWTIGRFNARTLEMDDVQVMQEREDGSLHTEYRAARATRRDGRWWFHDLRIQEYDEESQPRPGPPRTVRDMEMFWLTESPKLLITEIRYSPEFLSARAINAYIASRPNLSPDTVARYRVDYHSRLAMPWTSLVVTLLGISFGAETARRGAFLGVALAIGLFFSLYTAINIGLALGKQGQLVPWLAGWGPNLLFGAVGLVLLRRLR